MKVCVKDFTIEMEIKNNGMEFEVRDNNETHRGDIFVTKTGLTWCGGRTHRDNGQKVTWYKFISWMNEQN